MQPAIVLYNLTKSFECKRILEVAAGNGNGARMFAATLMKKGAVLVCTDISNTMIELFKKRFDESDQSLVPHIKLTTLESWSKVENEDGKKNLYMLKANNEQLPFEDQSFDCYIANLSLQLVDNHKNQLSEAYRVLQPGSYAAFTVWGKEENGSYFTFLTRSLEKLGLKEEAKGKSNFHLNDASKLRKDMQDAGFSKVKVFPTSNNINPRSDDEYLKRLKPQFTNKMEQHNQSEEESEKLWEKVKQDYYDNYGEDAEGMISFEVFIAIGMR